MDIDKGVFDNSNYIKESDNTDITDNTDIAEVIENIYSYESANELFLYLQNINWSDLFKLFLPLDIDNRDNQVGVNTQQITEAIHNEFIRYQEETSGKRPASLASYNKSFSTGLKSSIMNYLEGHGITYSKAKEERDKTIDILKSRLRYHIQSKQITPVFYDMKIDESEELKIKLQYTELGALIMWKTEIPHDLSALDPNTLLLIDNKTKQYTKKFNNMHDIDGKLIKYTEKIASELCLDILNNKGIPRCIQKHGKTELQIGPIEVGHGLLPSIYNDAEVHLTSDANNTGNVELSQVRSTGLTNITGKTVSFLNMDAGSAPTQIGFKESSEEQEQLNKSKGYSKMMGLNKPIDITIYRPKNVIMLHISSKPDDLTQYNIEIYSDDGKTVHQNKPTITNLSIETVIKIVNSVETKFKFNAALLKSLGDLIPYQTVCLQSALRNDIKSVNVMGSIDYSMIFQLLGNITYVKDGKDVTCQLNQRRILTGVNMENSNVYFPWSSTEQHVYQLLLYIYDVYSDDSSLEKETFKKQKKIVSTILYDYTHKHNTQVSLNFLMNLCIADLTECAQEIKELPNPNALILALEASISPLTTITNFKSENITKYAQNRGDDDDEPFSVNFDNLDYSLAYIIARQSMLPSPPPSVFDNISKTQDKSSANTSTKKRKLSSGGKRNKTIRKM